jgi:hypothetical protein
MLLAVGLAACSRPIPEGRFACLTAADCPSDWYCWHDRCWNYWPGGCQDASQCDDQNPCTHDLCDSGDCANPPNAAACEDGLFCTAGDVCRGGSCVPGASPCGTDQCLEGTDSCGACSEAVDCDDLRFCTGSEECDSGACIAGTDPCPGAFCDETGGRCVECAVDDDCADDLYCDGVERCDAGVCVAGTPPCSGQACSEELLDCVACTSSVDCDDDLHCTGTESCSAGGECVSSGDPCSAGGQLCDEDGDRCADCLDDPDCADTIFCNGAESCSDGACLPGAGPCGGQTPVCREGSRDCVQCTGNEHCGDPTPYCIANRCVACRDATDCPNDANVCTARVCSNGACGQSGTGPFSATYLTSDAGSGGATVFDNFAVAGQRVEAGCANYGGEVISRGFFWFDTAGLPDNAQVQSAELRACEIGGTGEDVKLYMSGFTPPVDASDYSTSLGTFIADMGGLYSFVYVSLPRSAISTTTSSRFTVRTPTESCAADTWHAKRYEVQLDVAGWTGDCDGNGSAPLRLQLSYCIP